MDQEIHISRPEAQDLAAMAELEASWNLRQLPQNAMSKTGALFRILGAERLQELHQDPRAILLMLKVGTTVQGLVIAYRESLTFEVYRQIKAEYAPEHPLWNLPFVYVKTIAVRAGYLGRGLGSRLLGELRDVAEAGGARHIIAGISLEPQRNERSLRLFARCLGAAEIGRHCDSGSGITWGLFCSKSWGVTKPDVSICGVLE